jgi:serine/threonine protein kinase
MRKLNHNNVMRLHAVYESDNSIYMTVELLEGGQLFNKIQSKHKFTLD